MNEAEFVYRASEDHMVFQNESPDSVVVLHYMSPSADQTHLESIERHLFSLTNSIWRWTKDENVREVLAESKSLREVAREFAREAKPFEYAHIVVASTDDGTAIRTFGDIFPIEQVFEEIAPLFENTPDFQMTMGEKTFGVRATTTWAPSHFDHNSELSQVHLLIFDAMFLDAQMSVVFLNCRKDSSDTELDRWDQMEIAFLCKNELLVFQTYRGTAQHVSYSHQPGKEPRPDAIQVEDARDFLRSCTTSLNYDGDLFSDAWGNLKCSPIGDFILFDRT